MLDLKRQGVLKSSAKTIAVSASGEMASSLPGCGVRHKSYSKIQAILTGRRLRKSPKPLGRNSETLCGHLIGDSVMGVRGEQRALQVGLP